MQIHPYPVAYGVIAAGIGAAFWHFFRASRLAHRVAMVMFCAGAVFMTIGVVPWFDALAKVTSGGAGLVGLLVVTIFAAGGFAYEMRTGRKNARVRAHICAAIFGVSLLLVIADSARLLHEAATSPARAGAALSQSVREIRSGAAAHAQTSHQAAFVIAAAFIVLVAWSVFGHKHERRSPGGNSGPRALPPGGSPRALPPAPRKGS